MDRISLKRGFLNKVKLKVDIDFKTIQKRFTINFSKKIIHLLKYMRISVLMRLEVYLVMHSEHRIMKKKVKTKIYMFVLINKGEC